MMMRKHQVPHRLSCKRAIDTSFQEYYGMADLAKESQLVSFPDDSIAKLDKLLYGYYLPAQNLMLGDRGHALTSRFVWSRMMGKLKPQPMEGVAVWTDSSGQSTIRTVIRDFFTGKYVVFDKIRSNPVFPKE